MRDTLFDVHPAVSALLSHRLVQTEARAALEGLCGCLDHSVPASAATTASVYCELASQGLLGPTKGGTLSPAIKPCPPIAANYFELLSQEADASPPWSDATFDVLFPLVHAMVTTSSTPQAREDALAVLSARTDLHAPRIRARRKQAIEAVLLALNGPSHRMRVSPESILVRLCENRHSTPASGARCWALRECWARCTCDSHAYGRCRAWPRQVTASPPIRCLNLVYGCAATTRRRGEGRRQ